MLERIGVYFRNTPPQKYFAGLVSFIGLLASLIQLYTFFGAISTPVTGSNFYVNSREFLAWTLIGWVYLFGLANAMLRRRWRKLYGDIRADNSASNIWYMFGASSGFQPQDKERDHTRAKNFKRDFSVVFVPNFIFVFLFTRAITATEYATGLTASPWGDVGITLFYTFVVTIPLMIVTSMFDFVLSIIWGD